MMEKRLTERLKAYWTQLCAGKTLPDIKQFNPDRISDIWPHCMTLQVISPQSQQLMYSYQHVGDELKRIYGRDITGQVNMSKMRDAPGWQLLKKIDTVVGVPTFEMEEGQFVSSGHKIVKYRACLMPFGNGTTVTHLVVGMSYKEF